MVLSPEAGLALLIVGFIGTPIVEQHGCNRGLVPPAYMWLRWVITVVVVAILVTVLVLRTMRAKIVF
jgi:predicted tellurium resistance membrane protein TerC